MQITRVIVAVDSIPTPADEQGASTISTRRQEAYSVIDLSEDEVFQNCLYDWYLENDWSQRLLELTSRFIIPYLQRKSEQDRSSADLLWKYYAHHKEYFEAAKVQLQLANSFFAIGLQDRIEYLSRAKANASTRMSSFGRLNGSKQEIARDITDLLDCASVQLDVLRRLENDSRLVEPNKTKVTTKLDGRVLSLDELYNDYVNLAGYHELSLVIFQLSDYRNAAEIKATWENMVRDIHEEAEAGSDAEPYVKVQERVRTLAHRVNFSESVFNPRK
jgi:nuclear pore complex protein Nup155